MCGMNEGTDILHRHSCCPCGCAHSNQSKSTSSKNEWVCSLFRGRCGTSTLRERLIYFFKGSMLNTYQHTKYIYFSLRSSFKRFKYVKGNIVQRWICFRVYTYLDDLLLEWHLINLFIDLIVLCYKFWVSALLMMDTNWVLYQLTKPWKCVCELIPNFCEFFIIYL